MAMQVGAQRNGDPVSEINTTPLIDVMLVLLIMLIITIPPTRQVTTLTSPRPGGPVTAAPDPVRIAVDFNGAVYWNGDVVTHVQWEARMKVEAGRAEQPEIHVEPHRMASYGAVAAVMASAQRLGLEKLGVVGGG